MVNVWRRVSVLGVTLAVLATSSVSAFAAEKKDIVDTAVGAGSFKTLAAALGAADLVGALKGDGPFTVFAPTDAAFAKLPAGTVETLLKPENKKALTDILTYHVVSGAVQAKDVVKLSSATTLNGQRVDIKVTDGGVMVDGAKVTATDIQCTNGVIHVIDSVVLPSSDNIPATATKAGTFNTLLAAVKAAGLVEALSGDGPLTVFAPTDAAFAKLPKGTVESLLLPENKDKLIGILTYHVVSGRVYSDAAVKAGKAKTLQGATVSIKANKDGAFVNQSGLVATDIDASNGVIHVIDQVLMPPADKAKVTKADARKMIEQATHTGTSWYNQGYHQHCAQLYERTARRMVTLDGSDLPAGAMTSLHAALNQASHTSCATTKSWVLRQGLDRAYASLR